MTFHHCVACCAFGVSFHFALLDQADSGVLKAFENALELFPPLVVLVILFGMSMT